MRRHVMMRRPAAKHIVAGRLGKRLVVNAKTIDHGFCGGRARRALHQYRVRRLGDFGPWLLDGQASRLAAWNGVLGGALLIALALPRGQIRDSYGGWDRDVI